MDIGVGARVQAQYFQTTPGITCLAGAQFKVGAQLITVEGVITDIQGDNPDKPTVIRVVIQPDDASQPPVEVNVRTICGVWDSTGNLVPITFKEVVLPG